MTSESTTTTTTTEGSKIEQPPVVFLHGYQRTGKDGFADFLAGKSSQWEHFHALYKSDDRKRLLKYSVLGREDQDWLRLSFAGAVRRTAEVEHAEFLAYMRQKHGTDYDLLKSIVYDGPDERYRDRTLRDLLIEIGMRGRSVHPDFWVKDVLRQATAAPDRPVVITDFRFPNEIQCFQDINRPVISIRLFRASVPTPADSMQAEHDLNDYEPDFIIMPLENAFQEQCALVARFPWAANYKLWMWSDH